MKVLIVANGMPTKENPLLGIFEFDQAKALAARGVEVWFFAIDLRSIRRRRKIGISYGESFGVKWYIIALPVGAVPLRFLCAIGKYAFRYLYKKVFKLYKPDLIHAHFTEIGYMCVDLATKYDIRLYMTEHSSAINSPIISSQLLNCAKYTYSNVDCLIAVSSGLQKSIERLTGRQSLVVHNIIDTNLFSKNQNVDHKGFRIVTVAGLIPRKRINLLLEAVSLLRFDISDLRLDIIGDGSHRKLYEQYVNENNLQDIVTFWGRLDRNQILNVFQQSDCFALVSAVETFGVVYVEAMASGLPVIATRCGGPEDFVNENNGILIDVDDRKALINAIKYMAQNINKYDRAMIKAETQRFSPEYISQKLEELYSMNSIERI